MADGEDAPQVDAHDVVEDLDVRVCHRAARGDPSGAHDGVEPSEAFGRFRHGGLDPSVVPDVGAQPALSLGHVEPDHLSAERLQRPGHRGSDAARRAGDQCPAPGELDHAAPRAARSCRVSASSTAPAAIATPYSSRAVRSDTIPSRTSSSTRAGSRSRGSP